MKVCPYACNVKMRLKQRQCVLGYPSIDLIQKHPSSLTELPVVCLYEHFSTYLPISWTVSHSVRSSLCFSSLHIFFILSASIYLSIHLFIRILVIINYLSLPQIIYLSSPPPFPYLVLQGHSEYKWPCIPCIKRPGPLHTSYYVRPGTLCIGYSETKNTPYLVLCKTRNTSYLVLRDQKYSIPYTMRPGPFLTLYCSQEPFFTLYWEVRSTPYRLP